MANNLSESAKAKEANIAKSVELATKELALNSAQDSHTKAVEDLNIKSSKLLEEQAIIKTAKEAFLKAADTVIWK